MIGLTYGNFSSSGAGFDPDAQAFITAAGITGETQQSALNQLVLDLKGTGSTTNNTDVWSDLYSLYPFCPIDNSTATLDGFKWNLLNPLDTDAAFRITWNNAPTVAVTGVKGNGSNQYGNTHFNPSTDFISSNDCGFTVALSTVGLEGDVDVGCRNGTTTAFESVTFGSSMRLRVATYTNQIIVAGADYDNIYTASRRGSTDFEAYKNGVTAGTNSTSAASNPNLDVFILCENNGGSPSLYSTREQQACAIHKGLTDNQAKDIYDAITTYNTALGR